MRVLELTDEEVVEIYNSENVPLIVEWEGQDRLIVSPGFRVIVPKVATVRKQENK